ncbi:hypothetical protein PHMEG_00024547 [Phytophthora megakarya]|uniref:CCHC-type domain-containing protein n=1 Tax=Phytophthora megakarya TaxID=4795 RepID=A0A225VDG5_9STRA|nr:hypothetical protein PHMEG_00024547 [Phytophthora megakarya]
MDCNRTARKEKSYHLKGPHLASLNKAIELDLQFVHRFQGDNPSAATTEWERTTQCNCCNKVGHIAPKCPLK